MTVLLVSFFLTTSLSLFAMWGAEYLPGRFDVVGSFIGLDLAYNAGIAFGLTILGPWQQYIILAILAILIVAAYLNQEKQERALAFGLILGGAVSNLLDRMIDGRVTDYIQIGTYPMFNLADSAICIGVGLLLWELYWDH